MNQLAYALLSLLLLGTAGWLWSSRRQLTPLARGANTAALFGLGLAAASSLMLSFGGLLGDDRLAHTQRMMGLAAQSISLPLLGLAALYLAWGLRWQPATWGRILLGLMAAFELTRRMDMQHSYQWLINTASLLVMLMGALLVLGRDHRPLLATALCLIGTLAPLFIPGSAPLASLYTPSAELIWLFPALLGAGATVGLLSDQAHNRSQPDVLTSPDDSTQRS
jgi:hypothetical protein